MKLSDLTAKTKSVTFDYDCDPVNLVVHTQLITPKLAAEMSDLDTKDAATRMQMLADLTARIIASWDVEDADGSMFPLDGTRLQAEIPLQFLNQCLNEAIKVTLPQSPAPDA